METQTFLELAVRLGYVDRGVVESAMGLLDEVERMLRTLHKRLTEAKE